MKLFIVVKKCADFLPSQINLTHINANHSYHPKALKRYSWDLQPEIPDDGLIQYETTEQ